MKSERARAFDAGQRELLERIADGAPLPVLLDGIVRLIERQASGMLCSILLVDDDGARMRPGAAPLLPASYMQALDGAPIGPKAGSCGTAAYRRERIIVEDIATHPYWEDYKPLALAHGLRACWSTPIFAPDRQVLGTFAMYYREPRSPLAEEIRWVDAATHLAAVAILRDRSGRALQRSEGRYRQLIDTAYEGIWTMDASYRITFVNRRMSELLGYDAEEMVGKSPLYFVHPSHRDAAIENLSRRRTGTSEQQQFRLLRKDGSDLWTIISGSPFMDERGRFTGAFGLITDITEQKTAENAVRQSEERLRAVIEHTPNVAIQWYDEQARVLFANQATEHILGWHPAFSVGKQLSELNFPPDEATRFGEAITAVATTGEPHGPVEFHFQRPDGSTGVLLSTIFRIPFSGGGFAYVCMDVDLTEHRRMEEAMRANERLRALIFSSIGDAIFYLAVEDGPRFRFLSVNPAFLHATGLLETEIAGRAVEDVFPAPSSAETLAKYRSAIDGGAPVTWEEVSISPTGVRYGEVTVSPLFDESGRCTNLVGTIRDITARKLAEEERRQLENQLHQAQRMQSLGTLAGGIAHDFNNILTAIGGNADLALLDLPADHPVAEHIAEIQRASRRATDLVRQILAFGRRQEPNRSVIDLRDVVTEALKLLRATLPKQVQIRTRLQANTPSVAADATQIHQLIMNLGTNASHAIGTDGGSIEVASELALVDPASGNDPPDLAGGRYAVISVSDTGCGMDEATLARVFEPFFTTKPQGVGTGLGLSVVHGIMKSHQGTVSVSSRLGEGTTFRLYFPAAETPTAPVRASSETSRGRGEHILYVDDEKALVFLATRILTRAGYRVTGHSDPTTALQDFRSRPEAFDAVATDISMPELSGPELAQALRLIRPDIPILMLTGFVRPEDMEAAQRLDICEIVSKPTGAEEFARVVERLLADSGRRTQPSI